MKRCSLLIAFAGALVFVGAVLFIAFSLGGLEKGAADYYLNQAEGRIVDLTERDDGVLVRLDSSEDVYWLSRDALEKSIQFERGDDQVSAPSWRADSGVDLLLHAKEEACEVVLLFHQTLNEKAERKVESVLIRLK